MLVEEVDDWWLGTHLRLDTTCEVVTWAVFSREFIRKYFSEDVHGKKEIDADTAKFSKCIKFENEMRLEIKLAIGIYEEDNRAHSAHYKSLSEKRSKQHMIRGKPYNASVDNGKQKAVESKTPSGGGVPLNPIKCLRCGGMGHHANEWSQPTSANRLIQGTFYVHNIPLIAIIDTCAIQSFISAECVKRLGLVSSTLHRGMVIDTPSMGSVTTSLVCLNYSLSILGEDFIVDLICLPLNELDIILGMNWLEFNRVYINCYDKTFFFITPEEEGLDDYLTTK
ncbi:uncharacterized protein LOC131596957 [Vicia villosa]|uniref:uncharacterized protein LOC131596957 n=1 Tax=Vicia villosa TaxID=3911 RepID=UPI00273BAACE|nr:uncharacterized protein LOC131596957 [Vicia villosa]